jgi:hypothetical protein
MVKIEEVVYDGYVSHKRPKYPKLGFSTQQRGGSINEKPSTSHLTWDFTNNRWECNQKTRGTRQEKLAVGFVSYRS